MMINRTMCTLKILKYLCFTKQKIKTKNIFVKAVWGVSVAKMRWQSIKKIVWAFINGAQSVKLEKRRIEFKNFFKQIPAPFKIYADFECNLDEVKIYEGS